MHAARSVARTGHQLYCLNSMSKQFVEAMRWDGGSPGRRGTELYNPLDHQSPNYPCPVYRRIADESFARPSVRDGAVGDIVPDGMEPG